MRTGDQRARHTNKRQQKGRRASVACKDNTGTLHSYPRDPSSFDVNRERTARTGQSVRQKQKAHGVPKHSLLYIAPSKKTIRVQTVHIHSVTHNMQTRKRALREKKQYGYDIVTNSSVTKLYPAPRDDFEAEFERIYTIETIILVRKMRRGLP